VANSLDWPSWAAGCKIQLPGDSDYNRIVSVSGTVATLQFPHQGDTSGTATLYGDVAALDDDVITVLDPVRTRGGVDLRPASGPGNLTMPSAVDRVDFGRIMRVTPLSVGRNSYFVDSVADEGDSQVRLRMMLNSAPSEDLIVGFNARCTLGRLTEAALYGEKFSFTGLLSTNDTTDRVSASNATDDTALTASAVGDMLIVTGYAAVGTPPDLPIGGTYYIETKFSGPAVRLASWKVGNTIGGIVDIQVQGEFYADLYSAASTTTEFPIPNEFLETLFLPLATVKFLSSPAMQNFDVGGTTNAKALELAQSQTEQGFAMLAKMNPQAQKSFRMWPGLG
jgi:hypothetical protein